MQRNYDLFLKDIIDNIEKINNFTEAMNFENFKNDEKTIYAVVRCLEIIGEASSNIPEELKLKYNNIKWRDIKDFRNKIIHKYWGVNLEIIWDIIQNEINKLKIEIKKILIK